MPCSKEPFETYVAPNSPVRGSPPNKSLVFVCVVAEVAGAGNWSLRLALETCMGLLEDPACGHRLLHNFSFYVSCAVRIHFSATLGSGRVFGIRANRVIKWYKIGTARATGVQRW